jgi:aminoglycoside 3-N-acetyltransferase I
VSQAYASDLLARREFWAIAAFDGDVLVGGLTAHALPMTRNEQTELFIYDIAVQPAQQRRGIGRRLIESLLASSRDEGIRVAFVPADNEDQHALDFYRAVGGEPADVTIFTFDDA